MVKKVCGKARELPKTLRKLYMSTKFPNHEISWNYGILCSVSSEAKVEEPIQTLVGF